MDILASLSFALATTVEVSTGVPARRTALYKACTLASNLSKTSQRKSLGLSVPFKSPCHSCNIVAIQVATPPERLRSCACDAPWPVTHITKHKVRLVRPASKTLATLAPAPPGPPRSAQKALTSPSHPWSVHPGHSHKVMDPFDTKLEESPCPLCLLPSKAPIRNGFKTEPDANSQLSGLLWKYVTSQAKIYFRLGSYPRHHHVLPQFVAQTGFSHGGLKSTRRKCERT